LVLIDTLMVLIDTLSGRPTEGSSGFPAANAAKPSGTPIAQVAPGDICFSFNAGQWVARPVCPAAQAANFGLLDFQFTKADRRPFKLPLRLGELPIEPAEERLRALPPRSRGRVLD
jgi:hypothetical protein